jgi:adenylate cyclase
MPAVRRLAAILAADVAGYSRLMGADEEGTHARLKAHLAELVEPKIAEHRGRVVKNTGDGVLAEFPSVVDAVRCAGEIQRGMLGREPEVADERRIRFRIGVNLGDVIAEGGDIFGDGVNVAARLEGLAQPGDICLSGIVHDQVLGKLDCAFKDMGDQRLRNIARPVRAYAMTLSQVAPLPAVSASAAPARVLRSRANSRFFLMGASIAIALALTVGTWWVWSAWTGRGAAPTVASQIKPVPPLSIVVLPFENRSNDSDQQYFADGVTDELTSDLSRIAGSFVIARTTAFTYKGKPVDVRQIGRDLGVRYVLEGSVRRSGNRVHINVQLIDAASEAHVWADQFDTDRTNLGETQSEITGRLANTLRVTLVRDASHRIEEARAVDPDAQDLVLRGWAWLYQPPSAEARKQAEQAFEQALQIDPRSIDASLGLTSAIMRGWTLASRGGSEQEQAKVERLLREALDRDPNRADAHTRMGFLLLQQGRFDDARIELETALQLDANDVNAAFTLGWVLLFLGQPSAAIVEGEKALRLDPRASTLWGTYLLLGFSHLLSGQLDDAVALLTKARNANPRNAYIYLDLAAALALKGDIVAGRAALDQMLELKPVFTSLASYRERQTWEKVPAYIDLREKTLFAGLHLLGFPKK